jgi:hypothetical protein
MLPHVHGLPQATKMAALTLLRNPAMKNSPSNEEWKNDLELDKDRVA